MRCWFGCDMLRDRDERGQAILRCADCGYSISAAVELKEIPLGPRHQPEPVPGQPKIAAVRGWKPRERKVG